MYAVGHPKVYSSDFDSFITSFVVNFVILCIILGVFWFLKSMRSNEYFFAPQYYDSKDQGNDEIPPLPKTPWAFVATMIQFPEKRINQLRGLDSVMYLRVIKMFFWIFVAYVPLGVGLLIPLDKTSGGPNDGIQSMAITNLHNSSNRLYIHVVVELVFTIIALYMMHRTYCGYLVSRLEWMRKDEPHNYTVMFKGIPTAALKSAQPQQYFAGLFPNTKVVGAHYTAEDSALYKLIEKRNRLVKNLAYMTAVYEHSGKRPTHRKKPLCGGKVDSITHTEAQIEARNKEIEQRYTKFTQKPMYAHVAFATFGTIAEASAISKSVKVHGLQVQAAPEQSDIYWQQLTRSRAVSAITKFIAVGIVLALIFLWSIPIVVIQGVANMADLSSTTAFSWLKGAVRLNPILNGLLQQYLPSIFTIFFLMLLPRIISAVVKFRGVYTKSQLSREVLKVYYLFLLFNVFVVSMVIGGIFVVSANIENETGWEVVQALGSGFSAQSIFFINYMMVFALMKYPLNLIRVYWLTVCSSRRRKCATEEQRREVQRTEDYPFGPYLAVLLLQFLIGFTYATVNAFIIPFMVAAFGVAYVVAKYMIIYVNFPQWDSGGRYWPVVFNRMIVAMVLGHVVLIAIFIFRRSPAAAVIGPLPIITIAFMFWEHHKFNRACNTLTQTQYPLVSSGSSYADAYTDTINALHDNSKKPAKLRGSATVLSGSGNALRKSVGGNMYTELSADEESL